MLRSGRTTIQTHPFLGISKVTAQPRYERTTARTRYNSSSSGTAAVFVRM